MLTSRCPGYGWPENKGYGSSGHFAAIADLGPTDFHRLTWLRQPRSWSRQPRGGSRSRLSTRGTLGRRIASMDEDEFEDYDREVELALFREYRDVVSQFRYVVETERRFYLANEVELVRQDTEHDFYFELTMHDVWVWDVYRSDRFVKSVRVLTFKDVNVEELPPRNSSCPRNSRWTSDSRRCSLAALVLHNLPGRCSAPISVIEHTAARPMRHPPGGGRGGGEGRIGQAGRSPCGCCSCNTLDTRSLSAIGGARRVKST